MVRLTKSDIEHELLTGETIKWLDANGKDCKLLLDNPKERRLFEFLLNTKVREHKRLPEDFIDGLSSAYDGEDDPASTTIATTVTTNIGPWRLQSIETDGFGGLNIWNGPTFNFEFDQESLLIEGPNGSGKSSLIGAILWALSGERPRDHSNSNAHEPKPVFSAEDKPVGDWAPIACYPPSVADLKSQPNVRVTLTFQNPQSKSAVVERKLENGVVTANLDPNLDIPSVLLETGLLMPVRLALIRFDGGGGRLTDAVQKLTGLDDLVAISKLASGLCHGSYEYLAYKNKELKAAQKEFDVSIKEARDTLVTVKVDVPSFKPTDTNDDDGEMAKFEEMLTDRATELTQVVANDLANNLDLTDSSVQNQVISAISSAQSDLEDGLDGLESWKKLKSIADALDEELSGRLLVAIETAQSEASEAVKLQEKVTKDSKFQLKAVAARWHTQHKSGDIENCPLCDHDLKHIPSLADELGVLQSAGDLATKTFGDNLNAILKDLGSLLPLSVTSYGTEVLELTPKASLLTDLKSTFVEKDRYAKILVKFGSLVESAMTDAPDIELVSMPTTGDTSVLKELNEKILIIERLIKLAEWFHAQSDPWSSWWKKMAAPEVPQEIEDTSEGIKNECLTAHLARLSNAMEKAEPYRKAATALRKTWKHGKEVAEIEKELSKRKTITESLKPLKYLEPLAEAVARDAIDGLSGRIANLLERIHLTEQLKFHDTLLQRKKGLTVRGGFVSNMHIDATLVANTSWLRAVLWAFVFSLREEAIEQIGSDQFPLFVFDDPQATFDAMHRSRWAQYIAALQNHSSPLQIILTTYDETFLRLIKIDGVIGREAMIAAAGEDLGHIGIFEGESLDRKWAQTKALNTPQVGREYMNAVRIYVEGLLKLMLRGEDADVSSFVLGKSREKIHELNLRGSSPWNKSEFKKLVSVLDKANSNIKYIEMSHHSSNTHLGMTEAIDVEEYWRKKLHPALKRCFQIAQDYHLLHGGLKALHAPPPSVVLPEGYPAEVQNIPLQVHGRAAALTDGRVADGRLNLDEFKESEHKKIVLAQHTTYQLTAHTLEPVARQGDLVLVKEVGEPPAKSLVVALSDNRILARRFELAENDSDIAVLTAQAINPSQIAPPIIAHKASLKLHQIVGIFYEDSAWKLPIGTEQEVCECEGTAIITGLTSNILGLIEVTGHSAEPYALDGQYLIISNEVITEEEFNMLDGKPVIASDTDDNRYFKRLRAVGNDQIILESLYTGGDYGPEVLFLPGKGRNCIARVWPVVGVLFELPS